MADAQKRILDVQAEIDRVAQFKGRDINSAVIHGTVQRFTVPQLKRDLQEELEKCMARIAAAKKEVIRLDQQRERAIVDKVRFEDGLKMRIAAYTQFQAESRRVLKQQGASGDASGGGGGIMGGGAAKKETMPIRDLLQMVLDVWNAHVDEVVRQRTLITRVWSEQAERLIGAAWHKWRTGKHKFSRRQKGAKGDTSNHAPIVSRGGNLLVEAALQRDDNVKGFADLIKEVRASRMEWIVM